MGSKFWTETQIQSLLWFAYGTTHSFVNPQLHKHYSDTDLKLEKKQKLPSIILSARDVQKEIYDPNICLHR